MEVIWIAIVVLAVVLAGLHRWLRGEDLSRYDGRVVSEHFEGRPLSHPDHQQPMTLVAGAAKAFHLPLRERLPFLRNYMDHAFDDMSYSAEITPVSTADISGEWVLAPGASPARRTLYIHGGSFSMGSPKGYRLLTSQFSKMTGGAVLVVDYRLLPEHSRMAGIEDCRTAYRWLLDNGPQGAAPAEAVFVAGDSAGGNLTLSLLAWIRDSGLRAPNAAVAMSPVTEACMTGPSVKGNYGTDVMLASTVKQFRWLMPLIPWGMALIVRTRPSNPVISPLFGDLHGLPPLLIHCSEAEMLLDDCRRYAAKAQEAGSPVRLQTWSHMVHVWHMFVRTEEAQAAFREIERFIESACPRRSDTLRAVA
jgi:monoterpene epsilon-lactone hydrolase